MTEARAATTIERSPDEVWKVLSDVAAISDWLTMVNQCEQEGDSRRLTLEDGSTVVERILELDDANRVLRYTIAEGPFPFERYLATWTVEEEGAGSRVTWSVDVEPEEMAAVMEAITESGVAELKAHMEGGTD